MKNSLTMILLLVLAYRCNFRRCSFERGWQDADRRESLVSPLLFGSGFSAEQAPVSGEAIRCQLLLIYTFEFQ